MGDFEVTQGVPVPRDRAAPLDYGRMPFARMGIGESFLVPLETGKVGGIGQRIWLAARRHGIRVRVKKGGDGLRVWRVA